MSTKLSDIGSLFNPLDQSDRINFGSPGANTAAKAAAVGSVAMLLAYAAKATDYITLPSLADKTKKGKRKLIAAANARVDSVDLDSSLRDLKMEYAGRKKGLKKELESEDDYISRGLGSLGKAVTSIDELGDKVVDGAVSTSKGLVKKASGANIMTAGPTRAVVTLASLMAGGYLGSKIADDIHETSAKDSLRLKRADLENQLEKELLEEYREAREIEKIATTVFKEGMHKIAADRSIAGKEGAGITGTAATGLALMALAIAGSSASIAYDKNAKVNPARARLAKLKKIQKKQLISNRLPELINTSKASIDAGRENTAKVAPKTEVARIIEEEEEERKITPADASDPYAGKLLV